MEAKKFSREAVVDNVIKKLPPIPNVCPEQQRRELEKKAHRIAKSYFTSLDPTATCSIVIVGDTYNIYVTTGAIVAGATFMHYSYNFKTNN